MVAVNNSREVTRLIAARDLIRQWDRRLSLAIQEFYNPDQLRDHAGRFADEGKGADEPGYKHPDEAGLTGIDKRIVDYVSHRPLTRRHEDVRSIGKYVPGIHYVAYSKTPFFGELNKLQGTPDVDKISVEDFAAARKKLFKAQPVDTLRINDLIATQPVVNKDKVKRNVKEDHVKALAVVHYGGKYFVMDGHHALAAAAKRSDERIDAHILEIQDKSRPESVVAAAYRSGDEIFRGATHINAGRRADDAKAWDRSTKLESGFITSSGRFVDRNEALRVARRSGQTGKLFGGLDAVNLAWDGVRQEFYRPDQARDRTGKWTDEGKGSEEPGYQHPGDEREPRTTTEPRLPGMTRKTSQPKLPGMLPHVPHHAEEFYSPNDTEMTFDSALAAMKGKRQGVALDVTHDVDFQLGLSGKPRNAIGDWQDGAENSVVNEISNIHDFDELRYSAALKGKQLHQKAVLAFEEDHKGKDALFTIHIPFGESEPGGGLEAIRARLDRVGLKYRTIIPGNKETTVMLFAKDADNEKVNDFGFNTNTGLQNVGQMYREQGNEIKITRVTGNGEFVGEAEGRTEAGENYDKIIRDYEAKFPNRRHYQHAAGPSDYGNRRKVEAPKKSSSSSEHLKTAKVVKTGYNVGGSSHVYFATFTDGSQGVWKPASEEADEGIRDNVTGPFYPREEAAYQVGETLGLGDLVAPTVIRKVEGIEAHTGLGSMQEFIKDADIGINAGSNEFDGNTDLARAAAFDYLIGNTDRHFRNWMIQRKDHKLRLIDNGLAFPNDSPGWDGNHMLLDEARSRDLDIPKEARAWIDKLPDIKKIMQAHGLGEEEIAGVERRANDIKNKEQFGELGVGFRTRGGDEWQPKFSTPTPPTPESPPTPPMPTRVRIADTPRLGDAANQIAHPLRRWTSGYTPGGSHTEAGYEVRLPSGREVRVHEKDVTAVSSAGRQRELPTHVTQWDEGHLKAIGALPKLGNNFVHASEYVNRHGRIQRRDGAGAKGQGEPEDQEAYDKWQAKEYGRDAKWNVEKGWHYTYQQGRLRMDKGV